jgi:hypothetical protein
MNLWTNLLVVYNNIFIHTNIMTELEWLKYICLWFCIVNEHSHWLNVFDQSWSNEHCIKIKNPTMSQDNKILEKYEIQKKNLYSRDKKNMCIIIVLDK